VCCVRGREEREILYIYIYKTTCMCLCRAFVQATLCFLSGCCTRIEEEVLTTFNSLSPVWRRFFAIRPNSSKSTAGSTSFISVDALITILCSHNI
jgi:hypothetical protein